MDPSEPERRTVLAPDGRTRTFCLVDPLSSRSGDEVGAAGRKAAPLVVAIHGGGDSALHFCSRSDFHRLAVQRGFVLALPEGLGDGGEADPRGPYRRSWNAGRCCGAAVRLGVDDVGFIAGLVDLVCAELPIDPGRRFAVGHSNGGMLAFRLALELPGLFAGIGVQSASIAVDTPGPTVATHLIAVHGGSDRHHPIEGGRGPDSAVESPYGSVREACARFAAVEGAQVELVEVPEGTHSWMGARAAVVAEGSRRPLAGGPPFAGFESATAIWEFLDRATSDSAGETGGNSR